MLSEVHKESVAVMKEINELKKLEDSGASSRGCSALRVYEVHNLIDMMKLSVDYMLQRKVHI